MRMRAVVTQYVVVTRQIGANTGSHSLRHSIATHLLEQGVPVEQVREFLGHAHLETTEIYTRVNQKQLRALMD